jgi:hypothetical protein
MHVLRKSRRLGFSLCLITCIGGSVSLAWRV